MQLLKKTPSLLSFKFKVKLLAILISSAYFSALPIYAQSNDHNLQKMPIESLLQTLAAEIALTRDRYDVALVNYLEVTKETKDPKIAMRTTQLALTAATVDVALEPALIWAKSSPNDLEAQVTVAAIYLKLNKSEQAFEYLQKIEKLDPNNSFENFLAMHNQLDSQDNKQEDTINQNYNAQQMPVFFALKKYQDKLPGAKLALASIYYLKNDLTTAKTYTQQLIKQNPNLNAAIKLHSIILLKSKTKDVANNFLQEMIKKNQNNSALLEYFIDFNQGNDDPKLQSFLEYCYTTLANNSDLSEDSQINLAKLAINNNKLEIAQRLLNKVNSPQAYYYLAQISEKNQNQNQALEYYKRISTGPLHPLAYIKASLILAENNNFSDAMSMLDKIYSDDVVDLKRVILTKVEIFNKNKQYKASLDILTKSLNDNKFKLDSDLLYARSMCFNLLSQNDKAIDDLRLVLQLNPDNIDALNGLGFMYINFPKKHSTAMHYLTKALKLAPNNPSVLDSMGWINYKTGNLNKAKQYLIKALNIQPDAQISSHLGEVLWQLKEYAKAKQVWQTALKNYPNDLKLKKTIARFTQD